MDVLQRLHPQPLNVNEGKAVKQGNEFLDSEYPDLSWIQKATIVDDPNNG